MSISKQKSTVRITSFDSDLNAFHKLDAMNRKRDNLELVDPANRTEWREWLAKNHTQKESVWVVIAKKGYEGLSRPDSVEEILCFGWIDSVANKMDEKRFKVLMSPRKSKSVWSKINKALVAKLIKQGLMHPAGLAAITLAKKNGSWKALNDVDKVKYPEELNRAFNKSKKAKANFDAFPPSTKKQILYWIQSAKTPETKAKRIKETISKATKNIRANQYTPKG
jgi:uncharacterized protein YdeI (YjbR/CyaY-like superfamily)